MEIFCVVCETKRIKFKYRVTRSKRGLTTWFFIYT